MRDLHEFLNTHPASCSWAIAVVVVEAVILLCEVVR